MLGSEDELGYAGAIRCINAVEKTTAPAEKLMHIMRMYAEMCTAVIDHTKGKAELLAMDDQMPVYIYILGMCALTRPMAEMNFLLDYMQFQERSCDTEQLLVTNLQASLGYLLKDFNPK